MSTSITFGCKSTASTYYGCRFGCHSGTQNLNVGNIWWFWSTKLSRFFDVHGNTLRCQTTPKLCPMRDTGAYVGYLQYRTHGRASIQPRIIVVEDWDSWSFITITWVPVTYITWRLAQRRSYPNAVTLGKMVYGPLINMLRYTSNSITPYIS